MNDDVLEVVDAAINGSCACLCGRPVTDLSPSAYFASERCSRIWHAERWLEVRGLNPQQHGAVGLARLAAMLEQCLHDLVGAFTPLVQMLAQIDDAAVAAASTVSPPKTGPQPPRRPPKTVAPGSGWHNYARGRRAGGHRRRAC